MRYSAALLDHFRNPRNAGMMRDPDGVGEAEDATCMDLARFFLRVDGARVLEARFQAYGCGPTIAAASVASEVVTGLSLPEAADLREAEVVAALGGLPADRLHAARVVAAAVHSAARDALSRRRPASG